MKMTRAIAIGSLAGFRGLPQAASYGAAKAALMNYIESLRVDLAPRGIAVTLAAPGFVVSKDTRKKREKPLSMALDPADRQRFEHRMRSPQ